VMVVVLWRWNEGFALCLLLNLMSFLVQHLFDIGYKAGALFGYVPRDTVPVELLAVECRSLPLNC